MIEMIIDDNDDRDDGRDDDIMTIVESKTTSRVHHQLSIKPLVFKGQFL